MCPINAELEASGLSLEGFLRRGGWEVFWMGFFWTTMIKCQKENYST